MKERMNETRYLSTMRSSMINFFHRPVSMLGSYVTSDLALETIASHVGCTTSWGATQFTVGLQSCSDSIHKIKRKQMPLFALRAAPEARSAIAQELKTLKPKVIDELSEAKDSRISESVSQILWKPDSFGAILNTSSLALNTIVTWKTLVLPGFAILMPLIAVIVPYIFLKFTQSSISSADYLQRVRGVLLQQITIPSPLRSRGADDRLGFFLESLFIGLTLAMFISSLWNQITTSLHQRAIWFDCADRGREILATIHSAQRMLACMKRMNVKHQRALRHVMNAGESALEKCAHVLAYDNIAAFGALWNDPTTLDALKAWIGHVDVLVSIAALPRICFPKMIETKMLEIQGVHHPAIESCISNNFLPSPVFHVLLTGPNRGGKSTYCKALGLAVVTAQSWGYAWADSMRFSPFSAIHTALETHGVLGNYSTFEAEIEFAKAVLGAARGDCGFKTPGALKTAPLFVMMDEIFHSTNASDGVAASKVFMQQLYAEPLVISMISTHYKELADTFRDVAVPMQLLSDEESDGRLRYSYKVAPGISTKSSVMEILIERGLVSGAAAAENTANKHNHTESEK